MTDPVGGRAGGRDAAYAIESVIARVLQVGTYVAILLVLVGVVGMLLAGRDPLARGTPLTFDLGRIPSDLLALRPDGFLWAGLVTVIFLPIGRVLVAGAGFLAARDRRLALVALAVLLVVSTSIASAVFIQG